MKRFTITELPLAGLKRIVRHRHNDIRGSFERVFCSQEFLFAGWLKSIAQINHSSTLRAGAIRGLHFQYSSGTEMKLVNCIRGTVWDVVVDLRANSRTYLQYHEEILSSENGVSIIVPAGFAHGFQAMTTNCQMLYIDTAQYNPEAEGGLRFDDPLLNISWPLELTDCSRRDRMHPFLTTEFKGLYL